MKTLSEICCAIISVIGPFTAKSNSPFYDKTQKGILLDNSDAFMSQDCLKLAEKETGLSIKDIDLYYSLVFTIEIKSHLEIPAAQEKLKKFVEKHFTDYKP